MAKLDLDIILLDESVVMNGFRVLMSGYVPEPFAKNPVGLFMHNRALDDKLTKTDKNVILPIAKWYDVRVEGDKLLGKPEFDDNDAFAKDIESKVQGGYLNAASVWLNPIEVSDDLALMLPGQWGPTITKWSIKEASIVDIPNCENALAIRNSAGKRITLSAETAQEVNEYLKTLITNNDMEKKILAVKLGLTESATDADITSAFAAMQAKANEVTKLTADKTLLTTENKTLKDRVIELSDNESKVKAESLVDGAIAANKLAAGERAEWLDVATGNYESAKKLIDKMTPYKSVETQLAGKGAGETGELAELMKLSGKELHKKDKLERLKELSIEDFKLKFKEAFKTDFTG